MTRSVEALRLTWKPANFCKDDHKEDPGPKRMGKEDFRRMSNCEIEDIKKNIHLE